MHKKIILTIENEVNVRFTGLNPADIKYIQNQTAKYVKGYFSTVRFKKRLWDGKESQFKTDGSTYTYMLPKAEELLISLGYDIDDIELVDNRLPRLLPAVTDNLADYLAPELKLHYYQLDAVEEILRQDRGIIEIGTSGGKSYLTAAIVKLYDAAARFLIIVPNDNLGTATESILLATGLNCKFVNADIKTKDRDAAWNNHRHIVATYQSLCNSKKYLAAFDGFIYDEAHIMGDMMYGILVKELAHCRVRIGLTGTVPLDKQKREKIFCRIGNDVIYHMDTSSLSGEGFISSADIHMVKLHHEKQEIAEWLKKKVLNELPWSWEIEERYLGTSKKRVDTIADLIMNSGAVNTLVLCEPEIGRRLAEKTGLPYIDGDTPPDERLKLYKPFDTSTDYRLIATYGTVGTGISINDIYAAFMLDPGKDFVKILQGIGRTLRLDSKGVNRVDIYDVYSDLFYSTRHKAKRISIYEDKKFNFNPLYKTIDIGL